MYQLAAAELALIRAMGMLTELKRMLQSDPELILRCGYWLHCKRFMFPCRNIPVVGRSNR
jgi:hypothetical protein